MARGFFLPNPDLFVRMYVRKEAVLRRQKVEVSAALGMVPALLV
jgi:hypothetical protein